jgi:sugar/nucleoside kinase (ribokinase family)
VPVVTGRDAGPTGALLFIDLADPEKRAAAELADAMRLLKRFRRSHRVALGLNQKESMEVGDALGLQFKAEQIEKNAAALREKLELDVVVIHPTKNAACATQDGSAMFAGPYCGNPKLTTGAGDNFNAGFCLGLLAGLQGQALLACGTAASGFYVRNGRSCDARELRAFLEQWARSPDGEPL